VLSQGCGEQRCYHLDRTADGGLGNAERLANLRLRAIVAQIGEGGHHGIKEAEARWPLRGTGFAVDEVMSTQISISSSLVKPVV